MRVLSGFSVSRSSNLTRLLIIVAVVLRISIVVIHVHASSL